MVDTCDPKNANALKPYAAARGSSKSYPQVFLHSASQPQLRFIGTFIELESMIDQSNEGPAGGVFDTLFKEVIDPGLHEKWQSWGALTSNV